MAVVDLTGHPLGEGMPRICIPVEGLTPKEVEDNLKEALNLSPHVVEWRADGLLLKGRTAKEVIEECAVLKSKLPKNVMLLFTIRTRQEGSNLVISVKEYENILRQIIKRQYAHMVDLELSLEEEALRQLLSLSKESRMISIVSSHHFSHMGTEDEIVSLMVKMKKLGADIPKVAMMANNQMDATCLLRATYRAVKEEGIGPVITMAMGKEGWLTRVLGEFYGSAMTFVVGKQPSAPGQIPYQEAVELMDRLHKTAQSILF